MSKYWKFVHDVFRDDSLDGRELLQAGQCPS
jgi:hypothetical protein